MPSKGFLFFAILCIELFQGCSRKSSAPVVAGQVDASRLKWNLETTVVDYKQHGRHDPRWDKAAQEALTRFAEIRSARKPTSHEFSSINYPVMNAMQAGCDDPMILYLHARSIDTMQKQTPAQRAELYRAAAEGFASSGYSPIRKFYASLRAAEARNYQSDTPQEVHDLRRRALAELQQALTDKKMPSEEAFQAVDQLLGAVSNNSKQHDEFYETLAPIFKPRWAKEWWVACVEGRYLIKHAWRLRGSGYADKVTDEGWKGFAAALDEAEKALTRAWELNPREPMICKEMITLELGQGKGRDRMELWFQRGMALETNAYTVCSAKLYYLEPKWYGSAEDMVGFGRECVASKKWGGRVPLILTDAHEKVAGYLSREQRAAYWKDREVWGDIKAAFDKFFELNPDAVGWRHNYARHAYWAEQWDELNRQIPLLGEINYQYFGGEEAYDKMVAAAKAHANNAAPVTSSTQTKAEAPNPAPTE